MMPKPLQVEPNPTQNQEQGTLSHGRSAPDDPGASADLRSFFGCAYCQNGSGRVCQDIEHLRKELEDLGVRNPMAFLAQYPPLTIREHLGHVRYEVAHAPQKVRDPVSFLYVASRDKWGLPPELRDAWRDIMAARAEEHRKAREAQSEADQEAVWAPTYVSLEKWAAGLADSERAAYEGRVLQWRRAESRPEPYQAGVSLFQGKNRRVLWNYLKAKEPTLASQIEATPARKRRRRDG